MSALKMITSPAGDFGKFAEWEELPDAYKIGDAIYPFAVIGFPHAVVDYVASIDPSALLEKQIALQQAIVSRTQERLDSFAQTRGYDSILSACTYVTSQIPKFSHEGQMAVQSRDATWAKLYQILAEVEAHQRPVPTCFEDVEADLPVLNWE